MVRRDRTKINNLRDDLKKFKHNLWELENSDGFQFCAKYADKCTKGNKFDGMLEGLDRHIEVYTGKTVEQLKSQYCLGNED